MSSKCTKLYLILPKMVSAVLVFWLSSVLVLVCCSPQLWAKTDEETCPMQKGHECCKKNQAYRVSETETDKGDCCIFKPSKTLSADLETVKVTKQIQPITEKIASPKPVYFIKQTRKTPQVYHSAIRNRGSTFLINCNFRI